MGESLVQINEYLDYFFAFGAFTVYAVIFIACFIENIFPPFPGDTFILAAGGLVAVDRLDLVTASLTIIAGGVSSVMVLYFFGTKYGREYFVKKDYKYFSAKDIFVMEEKFHKWGVLIIIFSRFVIGIRSGLAIVSGISKFNGFLMLIYSIISYILFGGLLMYIAIALVENFDKITYYVKTYNLIFWPILIFIILWFIISKIKKVKQGTA